MNYVSPSGKFQSQTNNYQLTTDIKIAVVEPIRLIWSRLIRELGFGAVLYLMLANQCIAEGGFPSRPLTVMVPYSTGGPSDALARIFAPALSRALGQPVRVENLGGASGSIAATKFLSAPPDGYQLFVGSPNEVILAPLTNSEVRIQAEQFRLVQAASDAVMVVVARADLPADNIDSLINLGRRSAQPLTYGSVGVGSLYHLILEDVQKRANIRLTHVPYKGNAPLLQDIAGGHIDFAVLVYSAAMNALAAQKRVKIIAQLGDERSASLADVPTFRESVALAPLSYTIWSGFMVANGTPNAVVQRLHAAVAAALRDPTIAKKLAFHAQKASFPASLQQSEAFFAAEIARYRGIARAIDLQPRGN